MNNKKRVCAVVVTHNRVELLKNLVSSLESQSEELDILIINNDSKDGTNEWLNNKENLVVINQENLGGAGGFYTGIKYAYDNGYEYIWCMDDDGCAINSTLKNLLDKAENDIVVGSVVYDIDKKDDLAFRTIYRENNKIKILKNKKEIDFLISKGENQLEGYASFFNSVLFPRSIIKVVGYPLPQLFMWGDESEYFARIVKEGFKINSILSSTYYHPLDRMPLVKTKYGFTYAGDDDWKSYIFFRNKSYLFKKYDLISLVRFLIINLLYRLLNNKSLNGNDLSLNHFFIASYHGLIANFQKKVPYK